MRQYLFLFFYFALFIAPDLVAQNNDTPEPVSYLKSGFSAPITFGFGLGVKNEAIFETTENDDSKLSFGGGLFIGTGLYYTTQKNIKFGSSFYYQASELRPVLENASSSFKRFVITPEVKFPIKLKTNTYLNFGGGYGFYLNGKMNIDADEIAGFTANAKYEHTGGIHVLAEYEEHFQRSFLTFGLKYYNVNYEYKSGDLIFGKFNGSGFDLYMSYSLRF